MNKKGIFDDVIEFIITFIALLFIFLFVTFYLQWEKEDRDIKALSQIEKINQDQFMLVWARTPVKVNQEYRMMAELATDPNIKDKNSDEYKAFEAANKDIFLKERGEGARDCRLVFYFEDVEDAILSIGRFNCNLYFAKNTLELILPDNDGNPKTLHIQKRVD